MGIGFAGPYPVEQFVEIGPSETAFVIPLEGDDPSLQTTTVSAEDLRGMRVTVMSQLAAAKADDRAAARAFEWIPTVAVRR